MPETFVGRVRELGTLAGLLAEARAGAGRLALVTGEPGIGKSRIATELAGRAEAEGWLTAWGRAWEDAGTPAYWPWIQVLRRLSGAPGLPPQADLARLLAPGGPVLKAVDTELARFQLFDTVARALYEVASARPLLVLLDDLHCADAATLSLLRFVARGLAGGPILVLGTARDVASPAPPELTAMLAAVAREARHVPLGRLERAEIRAWVEQEAPGLDVDRLLAVSEGNPLFVEELLAAARKRPDVAWTHRQLPSGVHAAVRAHLCLLSTGAQRLLETASVLGRELTRGALEVLATPEELAHLHEALDAGVLHGGADERLRFSHVLLRDELYARLPPDRRNALHRLAAQALSAGDRAAAAHHSLLGARAEDAHATAHVVLAAMGEAAGRLAHEDAARLGQRALAVLDGWLAPAEACGLMVAVGEALVLAGDLPAGQALGERAAVLADQLRLPSLLARAALIRAAELAFGGDAPALGWLRRALVVLPHEDAPLRVEVAGRLAAALPNPATVAEADERRQLRDDSVAMARRLGDERTLLVALHNASGAFADDLTTRERFAFYAEVVDLAEHLGTVGRVAPMLTWHVVSWLDLGEPEGARTAARRVEALLRPYPQPHHLWRAPLVGAVLAAVAGRFEEAKRLSRASHEIAREHAVAEGLMMYAVYRISLCYLRGDEAGLPDVLPLIEQMLADIPLGSLFRALWDAPLGRTERVRAALALIPTFPVEAMIGASELGWPVVRAGLDEHAARFHALAAPLLGRRPLAFAPGGFGVVGPMSLLVGQLAARVGRQDEALACFARAAELARAIESPPMVANVALAWAEALAAGDPAQAAVQARTAFEQARAVGMDAVAAKARALMEASGAMGSTKQSPATQHATEAEPVTLSRQGEHWLVATGERRVLLRDTKGLHFLAALVQAPHRAVHVLELTGVEGDAGPLLDAAARRAYSARADELRADLDEAAAGHDLGRTERARRELDALTEELTRAVGLGGRDRRAGAAAERARINVQRRLRDVIRRIDAQDRPLGRHLALSVKTGLICMYAPTWPKD